MVRRRVKLAQVVCAVYSLNKPSGVTKKEIVKFCKLRFGTTCTSKEFERVLERGLDEGLLTTFQKRYHVTKLRYELHWGGEKEDSHKKKRAVRGKPRNAIRAKPRRKRNPKGKTKKPFKGGVILEDCAKKTSSLYKLWKNELKRQIANMKNSIKKISKRGKSLCKKVKRGPKAKQGSLTQKRKEPGIKKRGRVEKIKNLFRLKRKTREQKSGVSGKTRDQKSGASVKKRDQKSGASVKKRDQKSGASVKKRERKKRVKKVRHSSKVYSSDSDAPDQNDRYRSLLRQTKNAVVHAKSWDKLNFTRQQRVRENKELVKNSQLVQKILTKKHAASWDDLNSRLKHMKEQASCSPQEGRPNGDGVPQHSASL